MEIIVPIEDLSDSRYGQIICYPRYNAEVHRRRIREIRDIGIKAIIFTGNKIIGNIPVLGKGCVGIVVKAISEGNVKVALKILRTDVESWRLLHEAEMLRIANKVDVGPRLLGYSENLLLMEYIDGKLLPMWVEGISGEEDAYERLSRVLRELLEQCWRLDTIGLDHGELSWADKHIIINTNDKPYILDFETASNKRRASNVTSISQYLFIGGKTAEKISQRIKWIDKNSLMQALKLYKVERTRERFDLILKAVGLLTQAHN